MNAKRRGASTLIGCIALQICNVGRLPLNSILIPSKFFKTSWPSSKSQHKFDSIYAFTSLYCSPLYVNCCTHSSIVVECNNVDAIFIFFLLGHVGRLSRFDTSLLMQLSILPVSMSVLNGIPLAYVVVRV
ncbi:hypothetical protein GJ496_011791 [Pomphorhynchus laevis]|nr:hypothetical protein GJ496_011791 [Pomphorhynchus laevis]